MLQPDLGEFEREWTEFLNELRTALPGVQLLFGFLLAVPFSDHFRALDYIGRASYFGCFLMTTGACAFLIAPSVYHRLHWRRDVRDKEEMLTVCNNLAIVGAALLALSMTSAVSSSLRGSSRRTGSRPSAPAWPRVCFCGCGSGCRSGADVASTTRRGNSGAASPSSTADSEQPERREHGQRAAAR
jgi:hypothetical protein